MKPVCRRCGECCRKFGFGLTFTPEDLERWRREGREDILRHVRTGPEHEGWGEGWVDPETGEFLQNCPFFVELGNGGLCSIHETKPKICRDFWCEEAFKFDNARGGY